MKTLVVKYGVGNGPAGRELAVLAIADQFRQALCDLYWQRHRALVDWRNETFPELWKAMVEYQAAKSAVWWTEKQIKAHHSEVRDRNAVPEDLARQLAQARVRMQRAGEALQACKQPYRDAMAVFSCWWQQQRDWKNVKSLAQRKAIYAAMRLDEADWAAAVQQRCASGLRQAEAAGKPPPEPWNPRIDPPAISSYGKLWMEYDLRERELYRRMAPQLHPAIRAEIVEASQPKASATSPGMKYRYDRPPDPRPWTKLTVQIPGGVSFDELLAGKLRSVRIEKWRTCGSCGLYRVAQQIGTRKESCVVKYIMRAHRELPPDAIIQRWTLSVAPTPGGRPEYPKRQCIVTIRTAQEKPRGTGRFAYRIRWTQRQEGVEVCQFWGDHVNERLVLPSHLLVLRMAMKDVQARTDVEANQLLASRGRLPRAGQRQGVVALEDYCSSHPLDSAAARLLAQCRGDLQRARRTTDRAIGCIRKIYETVARRVCSRHAEICPHAIDLRAIKRYDSRDLLREDVLPRRSREILFAVAPGKLVALLNGYGLEAAREPPPEPADAPDTDLFSSYVRTIRGRWRSNRAGKLVRSRIAIRHIAS